MAAVDVVRDAGPPPLAVVGVVVGEQVVAGVEVRLEVVAGPGGEDLEPGAVEPATQRAPPDDLRGPAVGPGRPGDPLVTHGNVQIVIDADLEARDDVVVEVVGGAGGDAEVGEELPAHVGHAVAVGVPEHGQVGHVHDVEGAVVPDHAEDRVEPLGEDDRVLPVAEEQDAIDRLVRRPDLVHRVLADEERPVGRGGHLAGILDGGDAGDQADLEPFGDLREPRRGRGDGTQAEPQRGQGP